MVITVENIDKSFKKSKPVLQNLSLSIEKGECCGLVGLNGAGKTTLIRTVLGLLKPNKGSVLVNGQNPYGAKGEFYQSIGVLLENDGFNGNLSFIENLLFYGGIKMLSKDAIYAYAQKHWSDLLARKTPVKKYSRGQRVQCALARTFLGDPALLIFDEPTATLDLEGQKLFAELVRAAQKREATIIISSHRLETIAALCHTVAHLKDGAIEKNYLSDKRRWVLRSLDDIQLHSALENQAISFEFDEGITTIGAMEEEAVSTLIAQLVQAQVPLVEVKKEESVL